MENVVRLAGRLASRLGVYRGIYEGREAIAAALKGWPKGEPATRRLIPTAAVARQRELTVQHVDASPDRSALRVAELTGTISAVTAAMAHTPRVAAGIVGQTKAKSESGIAKLTMLGPGRIAGRAFQGRDDSAITQSLPRIGFAASKGSERPNGGPGHGADFGRAITQTRAGGKSAPERQTQLSRVEMAMGATAKQYGERGQSALADGRIVSPGSSADPPRTSATRTPRRAETSSGSAAPQTRGSGAANGDNRIPSGNVGNSPNDDGGEAFDPRQPNADGGAVQHIEGDVFLDGSMVGRWMTRRLAAEAGRALSSGTAFDPRRNVFPAGVMIGG